jgi:hypothetical protein
MLGSSVWDFDKADHYATIALKMSDTPLDKFCSNLALGHIYFSHLDTAPEKAKIAQARRYFNDAIASLQRTSGTESAQFYMGHLYALWAAHEAFLKNTAERDRYSELAKSHWSKLSDAAFLIETLEAQVSAAEDGRRPEVACLFQESAIACTPTLATRPAAGTPTRAKPGSRPTTPSGKPMQPQS